MVSQLKVTTTVCMFQAPLPLLNVKCVLNFQGDPEKLLSISSLGPIWLLSQNYRLFLPILPYLSVSFYKVSVLFPNNRAANSSGIKKVTVQRIGLNFALLPLGKTKPK